MVKSTLENFCIVLKVILSILMILLVFPVALQVISRYVSFIPNFLWTEEIARFIFIWIVMIGSMIAVWEGTHFDVAINKDATTPFGKLLQQGIVHIGVLIFAFLFAYYGIEFAKIGSIKTSDMMRINLLWIYISVPLAGFVWGIFSLYRLYELYANLSQSKETSA